MSNNSNLIAIPKPAVQFVPNILIMVIQNIANAIVIIDWQLANDPDFIRFIIPLNFKMSFMLNEKECFPKK
mgnify:CR=1 FL=1